MEVRPAVARIQNYLQLAVSDGAQCLDCVAWFENAEGVFQRFARL
jgi:hypothetical protein